MADTYAYEEEQERKALLQGLHGPMKNWFNNPESLALRDRFGAYPTFWQDLLGWEHIKPVQKLFLRYQDTGASLSELLATLDGPSVAGIPGLEEGEVETVQQQVKVDVSSNGETTTQTTTEVQKVNGEVKTETSTTTTTAPSNPDGGSALPATVTTEGNGEASASAAAAAERERKRKSRWGNEKKKSRWGDGNNTGEAGTAKKSRWSTSDTPQGITLGGLVLTPETLRAQMAVQQPTLSEDAIQEIIVLQLRLEGITKRTLTVAADALARDNDPDKSPSPPPIYDNTGKRLNNRVERMKEAIKTERQEVIERLVKINPLYRPPPDYVRQKPFRKLYIPQDEYPTYNFIGLIIGPRGNTQKRLERETGTKIAIRGKEKYGRGATGSKDPNKKNRLLDDDNDELHVLIQADTEEDVERGAAAVGQLLVPSDDDTNEHKQKQLRELALINGTLREEEYCNICGEKGHRQFECPNRYSKVRTVQVKCGICGDTSHPTRDCQANKKKSEGQFENKEVLDKEYLNFMAELGEAPAPSAAADRPANPARPVAGFVNQNRPDQQARPYAPAPVQQTMPQAYPPTASYAPTTASYAPQTTAPNPAPYPYPYAYAPAPAPAGYAPTPYYYPPGYTYPGQPAPASYPPAAAPAAPTDPNAGGAYAGYYYPPTYGYMPQTAPPPPPPVGYGGNPTQPPPPPS